MAPEIERNRVGRKVGRDPGGIGGLPAVAETVMPALLTCRTAQQCASEPSHSEMAQPIELHLVLGRIRTSE